MRGGVVGGGVGGGWVWGRRGGEKQMDLYRVGAARSKKARHDHLRDQVRSTARPVVWSVMTAGIRAA